MAEKDAKEAKDKDPKDKKEGKDAAPAASGKRKLIIIGGAAATVLVGGGAAAWMLLGKKRKDEDDLLGAEEKDKGGKDKVKKGEPRKVPVFVDLETFTVNLKDDEGDRFMQIKLVAEVKDSASGEVLKQMMPSVRNEILLLLGSKKVPEVDTREGKEKLAQEIVMATNKTLEGTPAANSVGGVNFTQLIIQ